MFRHVQTVSIHVTAYQLMRLGDANREFSCWPHVCYTNWSIATATAYLSNFVADDFMDADRNSHHHLWTHHGRASF